MTQPARITIQDVHVGLFDMDTEGETVSPVIVAVASENLPILNQLSELEDKVSLVNRIPVFEIRDIDFLYTKKGVLTGKVDITISDESETSTSDNENSENDFDEFESVEEAVEAFVSLNSSKSQNIVEDTEEDYIPQEFIFTIDSTFLFALMAFHLTGDAYLTLFDATNKPKNKHTVINVDELQVMIQLPQMNSSLSENILQKIAEVTSERGMSTLHKLAPEDKEEAERTRRIRSDLFIALSDFMNGSEKALHYLKNLALQIDDFEERIILSGGEMRKGDDDTNTLISIINNIISKLSVNSILPRHMDQQEILNFRNDIKVFSNIISEMKDDNEYAENVASLSAELSLHDKVDLTDSESNQNIATSYITSEITPASLPEELSLLTDELNFGGLFERDWNTIDSMESFIDEDGKQEGTLGECLITALIVAAIRSMRLSKINKVPNMISLMNILEDVAPEVEGFWQLDAFSRKLANGQTELFNQLMLSLPPNMDLSQALLSSPIGVTLVAFARSLNDEKWSDDVLEIALAENTIITGFLKDVKVVQDETFEQFLENNEEIDPSMEPMIKSQIFNHAVKQSIYNLGGQGVDTQNIADELIKSMLTIADINTGKKTDSSFNSAEWIQTKTEYLSSFFKMDSSKFF